MARAFAESLRLLSLPAIWDLNESVPRSALLLAGEVADLGREGLIKVAALQVGHLCTTFDGRFLSQFPVSLFINQ